MKKGWKMPGIFGKSRIESLKCEPEPALPVKNHSFLIETLCAFLAVFSRNFIFRVIFPKPDFREIPEIRGFFRVRSSIKVYKFLFRHKSLANPFGLNFPVCNNTV